MIRQALEQQLPEDDAHSPGIESGSEPASRDSDQAAGGAGQPAAASVPNPTDDERAGEYAEGGSEGRDSAASLSRAERGARAARERGLPVKVGA